MNYKLPSVCAQLLHGSSSVHKGCVESALGGVGGWFGFFQPLHLHPSDCNKTNHNI